MKTNGGKSPKFTESDPMLGGLLGQLTGQGYVTRKPDEPHVYMITGKGVQWINPDEPIVQG
jgi:hypothetical protein